MPNTKRAARRTPRAAARKTNSVVKGMRMPPISVGHLFVLSRAKTLPRSFFSRSALQVARGLLGKAIVRRDSNGMTTRLLITEVEAYDGPRDKASHASRGETVRNRPMFGPAGHWYVYRCYGMHWLANVVAGPVGYPAAVLLRGAIGVNGPGRLAKTLQIDASDNNGDATRGQGTLTLADVGVRVPAKEIRRLPRIGVDYAGEWATKPYRFVWQS